MVGTMRGSDGGRVSSSGQRDAQHRHHHHNSSKQRGDVTDGYREEADNYIQDEAGGEGTEGGDGSSMGSGANGPEAGIGRTRSRSHSRRDRDGELRRHHGPLPKPEQSGAQSGPQGFHSGGRSRGPVSPTHRDREKEKERQQQSLEQFEANGFSFLNYIQVEMLGMAETSKVRE